MEEALSLYELNRQVSRVVTEHFDAPVWIVAEIAQMSNPGNGHCYLELIEKSERNGATVARARAVIWANRYLLLKESFERGTGQHLQAGMKVMVLVQITMHEAYGYSLTIQDIEPNYTVGEMQRRRQAIIRQLTDEGMIDVNRSLPLPRLIRRIAIISASNAAGYGDFCHQLANNDYGLKFYARLFAAQLQGEQTESSVIKALNEIYQHREMFDVVVIIRGGGSVVDLNSFDSYELALNVANFPLPVIVGIGHERDNTVLDAVANLSVKTPTAAAAFLIDRLADELNLIDTLQMQVINMVRSRVENEHLRLSQYSNVVHGSHIRLGQQMNKLTLMEERIMMMLRQRLSVESQHLDYIAKTIELSQPENILRRGFSITRLNGRSVKDASTLKPGDVLETVVAEGTFSSVVSSTASLAKK